VCFQAKRGAVRTSPQANYKAQQDHHDSVGQRGSRDHCKVDQVCPVCIILTPTRRIFIDSNVLHVMKVVDSGCCAAVKPEQHWPSSGQTHPPAACTTFASGECCVISVKLSLPDDGSTATSPQAAINDGGRLGCNGVHGVQVPA